MKLINENIGRKIHKYTPVLMNLIHGACPGERGEVCGEGGYSDFVCFRGSDFFGGFKILNFAFFFFFFLFFFFWGGVEVLSTIFMGLPILAGIFLGMPFSTGISGGCQFKNIDFSVFLLYKVQ